MQQVKTLFVCLRSPLGCGLNGGSDLRGEVLLLLLQTLAHLHQRTGSRHVDLGSLQACALCLSPQKNE